MLSLLRLLRISRLLRYIQRWEEVSINAVITSIDITQSYLIVVQLSRWIFKDIKTYNDDVTVGSLEWVRTVFSPNASRRT